MDQYVEQDVFALVHGPDYRFITSPFVSNNHSAFNNHLATARVFIFTPQIRKPKSHKEE